MQMTKQIFGICDALSLQDTDLEDLKI